MKGCPVKTTLVLATAFLLSLAAVAADGAKPKNSAAAWNLKLAANTNGLGFIDTSFENASPVWYEPTADGTILVHLLYDHERSSPNRAAGHIHFLLQALPGSKLTLEFINLDNVWNRTPGSVAKELKTLVVSENGRDWKPMATEALPTNRVRLALEMLGPRLYVARIEPYRISDLERLLATIRENSLVQITPIGQTVQGRELEIVRIGNPRAPYRVFIRARAHPWESGGNWVVEGVIHRLLQGDPDAGRFLQRYCLYVLPMANKDGVARGMTRFNLQGKDLNRDWDTPADPQLAPENAALEKWLETMIEADQRPHLALELHNDGGGLLHISRPPVADLQRHLERMGVLEALLRQHTWFTEGSTKPAFHNSGTLGDGWLERYGIDAVVHEFNCNWIAGLKDYPSAKHWREYGEKLATVFFEYFGSLKLAFVDEDSSPVLDSPFRAVDLSLGETASVSLADGRSAEVKLLDLRETRDSLRNAVRQAQVTVEINGQKLVLTSAGYHLPTAVGGVQVDCPITKGLVQRGSNPWALDKDARLRLWPAGAPWIQPGTFRFPLRQRWFAGDTQMANEPTFVNGDEAPGKTNVYYHWGLDAGGAEGLTEVIAATDGVVVSSGEARLVSEKLPEPVKPRYDVVYLRDGRGWYYRYSHLHTIDAAMKPGANVRRGQRVGLLGKEGGSGGWSHLHFDVVALQPSGRHGMVEPYAFYWQAYHSERQTKLQAVARPHHLVATGETVTLDGTRSWSALGPSGIRAFEWTFSDGAKSTNAIATHRYERPGTYSEILRVTDAEGRSDCDFAVVQVMNPTQPRQLQPTIHACYWPTENLKPGNEVTFKVRTFQVRPTEGRERWDFGDGSPPVEVQSDGNAQTLAKDGYATSTHRYARPGRYLVSVQRTNDRGESATGRLQVVVEK